MIAVFGRKDLGTGILHNRTDGGEGSSGWVPSEETRRKISEASKGNTYMLGKTLSEETKRKISETKKGKTHTEKKKKKQSEVKKGKTFSEEHRRNLSEAQKGEKNHFYDRTHSEETKRKISELTKGRKWWNDGCGNCKRMLECPGDGWKLGRK